MKEKLQIGLLIDGYFVPSWIAHAVDKIQKSKHTFLKLTVKRIAKPGLYPAGLPGMNHHLKGSLFYLIERIDQKLFNHHPDAFELIDIRTFISNPIIEVCPEITHNGEELPVDDLKRIINENLDVIIQFGFKNLTGEVFNAARYGTWSFAEGNETIADGGSAGIWEIIRNEQETKVTLRFRKSAGGGVKLFESYSSTDRYSFKRNRDINYWKASSILHRKLAELHQTDEGRFFEKLIPDDRNLDTFQFDPGIPGNLISIKTFLRLYSKKAFEVLQHKFVEEQWFLLYRAEKTCPFTRDFTKYKKLIPPPDRFWADPFVIKRNGTHYIFFEELIFKENKGRIAAMEVTEDGLRGTPVTVLDRDCHLSYPFLIEDGGELYMIPETSGNKTIELYRCTSFPDKWVLEEILMDNIFAVDTTVFKSDSKYWMFCNVREQDGASPNDELYLFYSNDLVTKDWIPHPENPIVSDVKNSRPAGKIFIHDGKIYRPSQNCAKRYGYGIQINEIVEMTASSYKERNVDRITPDWEKGLLATHTLNCTEGFVVMDAMFKRRKMNKMT